MNQIRCPQCGAVEQFTRAELLYEASVSNLKGHVSGSSVSAGLGAGLPAAVGLGLGVGALSASIQGTQATQLSRRVAPPSKPWVPSAVGILAMLLVLAAGVVMLGALMVGALLAGLRATDPFATLLWRVVAAVAVVVSALLVGFSRPAFARERKLGPFREALEQRWRAQLEAWRRLWFCARCGHYVHLDDAGLEWTPARVLPEPVLERSQGLRHFGYGFLGTLLACSIVAAVADLGFEGMAAVGGLQRSQREADDSLRGKQRREGAALQEKKRQEAEAADTKACDGGDGAACARMAERYADGSAPDKQLQYLKLACAATQAPACAALGELYLTGSRYVAASWGDAGRFFGQACDLHHGEACLKAGRIASYREQAGRYEQACELSIAEGCAEAASQYFAGLNRPKDVGKALALLEKACSGGSMIACGSLRDRYRAGRDVPADPAKAKAYDDQVQAHWKR